MNNKREEKKKKKFRIIDTYALSNNFKRINSPPRIDFDFSTFTACSRKLYINYYINCNNTIDNFFEIKIFPWNQCDWIQVRGIAERSREKTSDYLNRRGKKKERNEKKRDGKISHYWTTAHNGSRSDTDSASVIVLSPHGR